MESHHTYYSEYSIKSWVSFLLKGEIVRPPYQRKFVWNLQKAYELAHAVLKGNFIPPVVIAATQYDFGEKKGGKYQIPKGIYLVDGQQRLTSLLLFYLGIWPSDSSAILMEEDGSEDDYEEEIDDMDTPLDELVAVFKSQDSICKLVEELLKNKRYLRLEEVPVKKGSVTKKLKSDVTELVKLITDEERNEFLSRHLGYSYVRSSGDWITEKHLFTNLFRDINSSGQKLLPAESRRAMYYLEPTLKTLFEPEFLKPYKIGTNNIDFPRYLSYAHELFINSTEEYYLTDSIAYGYSNKPEDYILKYVTKATSEEKQSKEFLQNMPKFEKAFTELFSDSSFEDIAHFEIWIFGLIFWTLFHGKEIDTSKRAELESIFSQYKPDPNKRIGGIRERLKKSVDAYERIIKDA